MAKKNNSNKELKPVDPNPEVEVEDLEDKVEDLKVDDKETDKSEDKKDKDDKEEKEEVKEEDKTTTVTTEEKEETDKDDDKKTETVTETEVDTKTTTKEEESAPSYQQPYTPKLSQSESQPPTPPPKPPRPLSPFSQAQAHLKEAFPDTEDSVIKAVLVASGGEVEPAFTALLSMSDPNFKPDIPPRQQQQQQRPIGGPGSDASMAHRIHSPRSQIEADERLARQLAGQYDRRTANRTGGVPARYRGSTESNRSYSGRYDERRESREEDDQGFFQSEDWQDFSNQVVQGFNETKNKVNSWVKNLSNKIDGVDGVDGDERQYRDYEEYGDDYYESPRRQRPAQAPRSESTRGLVGALGSGRESQESQRSYQEFYSSKSSRSKTRVTDDGEFRSISLKNNDMDDDDKPLMPPRPPAKDALAGATAAVNKAESNKWEPLKAVEPQPEEDKDPFFIGDSDDEDDKEETKKEVKEEVKVTEDKD